MHGMTNGNMGSVFRRMQQVAQHAEASINDRVAKASGTDAEITEGSTADWYLVNTFPGDDVRALRWLARRRFGVFRPMQQRTDKRNGNAVQGWEPAFPGWIFVYVWDIKKLKARLLKTPGVMGMLCDRVTLQPIPVDQPDENGVRFIDKLRALTWIYSDNAPRQHRHQPALSTAKKTSRTAPRRPTKHERKTLDRLKNDFKQRRLEWDASTWDVANGLEPHLRIALLTRTLMSAPPLQVAQGS